MREALGAGIPSAGVGCAIARAALARMAGAADGRPFDEDSLTEDYEIGLRLTNFGGRAAFVAMPACAGGPLVATRAYFPHTLATSVRQKTRWMIGIACAGWDRLRWQGGLAERWMLLRDRRAVLAAVILAAAYAAMALSGLCWVMGVEVAWPRGLGTMLAFNFGLLAWRLAIRFVTVARFYGWREGCRAVPRVLTANVIAMMAARRALAAYVPGRVNRWDKTAHHFPTAPSCD